MMKPFVRSSITSARGRSIVVRRKIERGLWRIKREKLIVPRHQFAGAFRALCLSLAVTAFVHGMLSAEVKITARVTPTEITVGDPVRYQITVTHPAEARVELPEVRGNVGSLEVLAYTVRGDSGPGGQRTVTHTLTLAAYEVGPDTLPSQRVEIRTPSDTSPRVYFTQPTVLSVKAIAPENAQDIAEILDDETLPRSLPWGLPLLLLAIAVGLWGLRRWKRRRALRPVLTVEAPPPTVGEAALARLTALEQQGLIAANRSREFAFVLSEILREYLANRFGIDALEATTGELLMRVENAEIKFTPPDWLRDFCEELDAVKYADGTLSVNDETRLLMETRGMIRATTPLETVPKASQEPDPVSESRPESKA